MTDLHIISELLSFHLFILSPVPFNTQHLDVMRGRCPLPVDEYASFVYHTIQEKLSRCPYSLFVFSDIAMMPLAVLDALVPFLQHGANDVNGVDYTKAIFIFESNMCAGELNMRVQSLLKTTPREEIPWDPLAEELMECIKNWKSVAFVAAMRKSAFVRLMCRSHVALDIRRNQPSALVNKQLVHFVPFLPLEGQHVRSCARVLLQTQRDLGMQIRKWKHLSWDPEVETHLAGKMARFSQFVVLPTLPRSLGLELVDMPASDTSSTPYTPPARP